MDKTMDKTMDQQMDEALGRDNVRDQIREDKIMDKLESGLRDMILREYNSEILQIHIGCNLNVSTTMPLVGSHTSQLRFLLSSITHEAYKAHDAYVEAIEYIRKMPVEIQRTIVISVFVDGSELVRYPYMDVEFRHVDGSHKLGVTGDLENVNKLMGLLDE